MAETQEVVSTDNPPSDQTVSPEVMIDVMWSVDHENILVEWADKAMCYRWLHGKANSAFSRANAWYTIPVIVISTLTGTANFAQDRVPATYQGLFVMTVGAFNILAGIITTIQQFLKITQLNEAHRVSSIAWDKFYRNIKTELAKHPKERLPVIQFLKMCKEEFDRLMETSPVIPDEIIKCFNEAFKNAEKYGDIIKPELCDSLISTNESRNPWYTDENLEKEQAARFRDGLARAAETSRVHRYNTKTVTEFKNAFYNLNNREPLLDEVIDNLQDTIDPNVVVDIMNDIARADRSRIDSIPDQTDTADLISPIGSPRTGRGSDNMV